MKFPEVGPAEVVEVTDLSNATTRHIDFIKGLAAHRPGDQISSFPEPARFEGFRVIAAARIAKQERFLEKENDDPDPGPLTA